MGEGPGLKALKIGSFRGLKPSAPSRISDLQVKYFAFLTHREKTATFTGRV